MKLAEETITQKRAMLDLASHQIIYDMLEKLLGSKEFSEVSVMIELEMFLHDYTQKVSRVFLPIIQYLQTKDEEIVKLVRAAMGIALVKRDNIELAGALREVVRNGQTHLRVASALTQLNAISWPAIIVIFKSTPHLSEISLEEGASLENLKPTAVTFLYRALSAISFLNKINFIKIPFDKLPQDQVSNLKIFLSSFVWPISLSLRECNLGVSSKESSLLLHQLLMEDNIDALDLGLNHSSDPSDISVSLPYLKRLNLSGSLTFLDPQRWASSASSLRALDLGMSNLGQNGGDIFVKLKLLPFPLRSLSLDSAYLGVLSSKGWSELGDLILNLTELSLRGNVLTLKAKDTEFWTAFCSALGRGSKLEKLDLSINDLGECSEETWPHFCQALSKLHSLRSLDLSNNQLSKLPPVCWELFCSTISKLPHFEHLDLSRNSFCTLNILNNLPSLVSLDFSGNRLDLEGTEPFLRLGKTLPKLCRLNLSGNKFTNPQQGILLQFIQNLRVIKELNLADTQLVWNYDDILCDSLVKHPTLIKLNLSNQHFEPLGLLDDLTPGQQLMCLVALKVKILDLMRPEGTELEPRKFIDYIALLIRQLSDLEIQLSAGVTQQQKEGSRFAYCQTLKWQLWQAVELNMSSEAEQIEALLQFPSHNPFFLQSRFMAFNFTFLKNIGSPFDAFYTALTTCCIYKQQLISFDREQMTEFEGKLFQVLGVMEDPDALVRPNYVCCLQYLWLSKLRNVLSNWSPSFLVPANWTISSRLKELPRAAELGSGAAEAMIRKLFEEIGPLLPGSNENKTLHLLWRVINKLSSVVPKFESFPDISDEESAQPTQNTG